MVFIDFHSGGADKRKSGGEGGDPSAAAKADLQWKADVRLTFPFVFFTSLC